MRLSESSPGQRKTPSKSLRWSVAGCAFISEPPEVQKLHKVDKRFVTPVFDSMSSLMPKDGKSKLVLVMAGLPARGKSFIARKIKRYLEWHGLKVDIFNAGRYRRDHAPRAPVGPEYFDSNNEDAVRERERFARLALEDMLRWMFEEGGDVGVFDATNTTRARRAMITDLCRKNSKGDVGVIFIESICDDPQVIDANIRSKVTNSPDYAGYNVAEATRKFKARIEKYKERYQEVLEPNLSYIKVYNLQSRVLCNRIFGRIGKAILVYLITMHIGSRPICLTRPGEAEETPDDDPGTLVDFPNDCRVERTLSDDGRTYAKRLALYLQEMVGAHEFYRQRSASPALDAQRLQNPLVRTPAPASTERDNLPGMDSKEPAPASTPRDAEPDTKGREPQLANGSTDSQTDSQTGVDPNGDTPVKDASAKRLLSTPPTNQSNEQGPEPPTFGMDNSNKQRVHVYASDGRVLRYQKLKVMTSLQPTAVETARAVGGSEEYANLNPMHRGAATGMVKGEIQAEFPKFSRYWAVDPMRSRWPGGETFADVRKRINGTLIEIEQQPTPVLVISHVAALQLLVAYFTGRPVSRAHTIPIPRHTVIVLRPLRGGSYAMSYVQFGEDGHPRAVNPARAVVKKKRFSLQAWMPVAVGVLCGLVALARRMSRRKRQR